MNHELNNFLCQLQNRGWQFGTQEVFSRTDFYYLLLMSPVLSKKSTFKLLMNSEETVQDLKDYMKDKYGVEL